MCKFNKHVIPSNIVMVFYLLVYGLFTPGHMVFGQEMVRTTHDFVTVEDSIRLSTDLYLPGGEGPFPCLLIRTPYNKKVVSGQGERFAGKGYAVIIQDTRGRYASSGTFYPFRYERNDGLATVEWMKSQSWCNGKIGGWGASYLGYTQWVLSDVLDAICPAVTSNDMYDCIYPEGLFSLQQNVRWTASMVPHTPEPISPKAIEKAMYSLPLISIDDSVAQDCSWYNDWLAHPQRDEYWRKMAFPGPSKAVVLSIGGWYDIFLQAQIDDFQTVNTLSPESNFLVIGPWAHGSPAADIDFSDRAEHKHVNTLMDRFYARYLKGEDVEIFAPPFSKAKYNLFIMHRNTWMGFHRWPPGRAKFTPLFFAANETISMTPPKSAGKAAFGYDPENPFPSLGGTSLGANVGPAWQNPNSDRKDQVFFESETLTTPLIIAGPMLSVLFVKSDVPATDFIVCLQDVFPDGRILNIQEGAAQVTFQEEDQRGVQRVAVNLWATGYELKKGHKLRAVVTSSWFPRFNRNLNTGLDIHRSVRMHKANQVILFGPDHLSGLYLPVIHSQ